jgi:hypothetical protein
VEVDDMTEALVALPDRDSVTIKIQDGAPVAEVNISEGGGDPLDAAAELHCSAVKAFRLSKAALNEKLAEIDRLRAEVGNLNSDMVKKAEAVHDTRDSLDQLMAAAELPARVESGDAEDQA